MNLKKRSIKTFRFSKVMNASVRFVFDWCTDYREDDPKITGAKMQRIIIEKTPRRAVYINRPKGAKVGTAINIITLHPPNRWHLDSIGDQRNVTAEYRLKRLGPERARLDMTFKRSWKIPPELTLAESIHHLNEAWGKFGTALEKDYKNKKRTR